MCVLCARLLGISLVCMLACLSVWLGARGRGEVSTASQSVRAPAPFHCGPASETEHEAQGIEVH